MNKLFNRKNSTLFLHLGVWAILFILPYSFASGNNFSWKNIFIHSWFLVIGMMIIFYTNYLKWVDAYLLKNKTFVFAVLNVVLIGFFVYLKYYLAQTYFPKPPRNPNGGPAFGMMLYLDAFYLMIPVVAAIAIKSMQRFFNLEVKQKETENIQLQTELQQLKYQLQPHFFFNALNNIYALVDLDQEKAKESIHSLSKMMRFMLYETDTEEVLLKNEIEFLKRYNELMKLRLGKKVQVSTDFPEVSEGIKIAPLLFISLVENAYKHGVSATLVSQIDFKIKVSDSEIEFISTNDNFPKDNQDETGSGIGLENLRKRLNLYYAGRHIFTTELVDQRFIATLKINR